VYPFALETQKPTAPRKQSIGVSCRCQERVLRSFIAAYNYDSAWDQRCGPYAPPELRGWCHGRRSRV